MKKHQLFNRAIKSSITQLFSYSVIIFALCAIPVSAQQIPVSTIFMENPFSFNPAVAGSDNMFKVRMNTRMQWLGFGDGPFTAQFSGYGPHRVRNIGYGGSVLIDKTGAISMTKANATFATNFPITTQIRTSFGINFGFLQMKLDGSQFGDQMVPGGPIDPRDDKLQPTAMPSFNPDAGVGVFVYHYDWYVGLSAQQLFNNNVKFTKEGEDNKLNRIKTHFYGYGGYKQPLAGNFMLEPAVLFTQVVGMPMQVDFNVRLVYDQNIWGGLSIRNTFESFDDFSLIFGYIHERSLYVAVAYDFTFAQIRKFTAGSLELVIGYNFEELRRGR